MALVVKIDSSEYKGWSPNWSENFVELFGRVLGFFLVCFRENQLHGLFEKSIYFTGYFAQD